MAHFTRAPRSFSIRQSLLRHGFVCILVTLALSIAGCGDVMDELAKQKADGKSNVTASVPPQVLTSSKTSGDPVRVASFNIQVFGTSKLQKPKVVDVLTKIVRKFDVVAIQEVRSKDDSVLPRFVDLINSDGGRYDFVIGERLGRTTSKEQYAFVFNTQRIEFEAGSDWTVPDPDDRLHREPFVARFRVRGVPTERAFTFTLIDIHTDPDETKQELDTLDEVFQAVQQSSPREDDVILLGDLNVDDKHLGELGRLPNMGWAIKNQPTNTLGKKQYDNIVFNQVTTTEYTGSSGVLDFQTEFGLTTDEALEVSDHRPIWATFSPTEGSAGIFAGEGREVR